MAEVIGIVGSIVGILAGAELAYQKLKSIKGLPEAFSEVALRVPLAQQILRDVEDRSREASEEAAKAVLPIVKSCKGNAEALKTTLEKLEPGETTSAWNQHVDRYMSLIKSRGKKGRVEDLLKKILQDIYTLASHHAIKSASSEQLDSLKEAIEKVGEVRKSVPDELLEDGTRVSISHGGQGPMLNQVGDYTTTWNNFGSGNINNISGDAHFGPTLAQKRREVLRGLNCAPYEDHKNRNPEAMSETCGWFTQHQTFQSWMTSPEESFLWVSADLGCGKSVLARYLIDRELETQRVIYFFFKDGLDDQDNVESAIKCLLHQLLSDEFSLFTDEVLKSLEELGTKRSSSFNALWNIFVNISTNATNATNIICVLDGLDECEASGWSRMAKGLGDLYENGKIGMRFILLSRPYSQIRRAIRKSRIPHINLRGEDEAEVVKISAEINIVIRQKVADLVLEFKLSLEEEEKVLQRLTQVSNRTYLWIHVICDMLENLERVENNSLERFLDRLPETVEDAYDKILRQSVDVQAAKTLLHIVVAAARPLSVEEMAVAMAVNGQQSFGDELSVMSTSSFVEGMRNICGLFVAVVKNRVLLIHQTAREFLIREARSRRCLKWEACLKLEESNQIITRICVWYLLNLGSRHPLLRSLDEVASDDYANKHAMFDHASRYWVSHYQRSKLEEHSDLGRDIFQLCDTSWTGCTTWYTHLFKHNRYLHLHSSPKPLELASYLGIDHTVRRILVESNYNLHAKDACEKCSPLYLAADSGSHNVVVMLLKTIRKYRVYQKRINIGLALEVSSKNGHESIVEALLQASGTKVSLKNAELALLAAVERGHDPIVRSILSSKPSSGLRRKLRFPRAVHYHNLLSSAAMNGRATTIKTIFESGKMKPDDIAIYGQMPLMLAAYLGHANVASILLETGQIDINSQDWDGRTPLSHASKEGRASIVKMLLETGQVDINLPDKYGYTPFYHAEEQGHMSVAKMLLETGQVDINSRNQDGSTPLTLVAQRGQANFVTMLLDTGQVDVNLRDSTGDTALLIAVAHGHWEVIETLLATGKADTNARNTANMTPLVVALMRCNLYVANLLLTSGNIHENQLQPGRILVAAAKGDLSIFMPLYEEWNAELRMTGEKRLQEHSIMVALENRSTLVFEYLLDAGNLDINGDFNWGSLRSIWGPPPTNMHHSTLLVRAVERGYIGIVDILLSRKANAHAKSSTDGATALSTAVALGRLDIVKTLLQVGNLDFTLRCQDELTTRLVARKAYVQCCIEDAPTLREIIVLLNDQIRAMPDGGKALRNLERSIIEEKGIQLRKRGMNFDDSDAES